MRQETSKLVLLLHHRKPKALNSPKHLSAPDAIATSRSPEPHHRPRQQIPPVVDPFVETHVVQPDLINITMASFVARRAFSTTVRRLASGEEALKTESKKNPEILVREI